jgi:hypothetical protein
VTTKDNFVHTCFLIDTMAFVLIGLRIIWIDMRSSGTSTSETALAFMLPVAVCVSFLATLSFVFIPQLVLVIIKEYEGVE